MKLFKKSLAALIITVAIHAALPLSALADLDNQKRVTPVPPGIITTPREKIPVEQVKKPANKWWVAGVALLAIAALGGGGGGGGPSGNDTGSIVIDSPAP